MTNYGNYLGYSNDCIGGDLGSTTCPVLPQQIYCVKTKTCASSATECEGMSPCRQDPLNEAFDPENPPNPTRTSWESELGYELFGMVHIGTPSMRVFTGVMSVRLLSLLFDSGIY